MAKNRNLADDVGVLGSASNLFLSAFEGARSNRGKYVGEAREDPNKFIDEYGMGVAESYGADAPGLTPILAMRDSLDEQRKRVARSGGKASTILTGGRGLMQPSPVARRVLLG